MDHKADETRIRELPQLMDVHDVAAYLGIHPVTVRVWAGNGKLPAIHLSPRALRFRASDIVAVLEARS